MKWLEKVRKYVFWLFDILRGSLIRRHYRDIAFMLKGCSPPESMRHHEESLSTLLNHAVLSVPFYKDKAGFKSLVDFSVIDKSIVRNSFNQFISNKFEESELISAVTSGSTGTPFKVYHDVNKKHRNSADVLFFAQLAGYDLGDRLVYLKIFVKEKMKNPLTYWMNNIIPIDVIHLNDETIKQLIHQMENDNSSISIIGYSSALELICRYLDKSGHGSVKAHVKSVIAISETLNDYTKISIQKYFNISIVSRYSNLENGIIAQQEISDSEKYLINSASYIVEILRMDTDERANPGETGRIVITDLFNFGMPLIRYDTCDIGAIDRNSIMPGKMYLEKVEGRKLDMLFDTTGNLVSSYIMYKNMWQYTDIIQYQLIQEDEKMFTFKINSDRTFNKLDKIIKEFKLYLGQDAVIVTEYVSEIPLLSSGKRKIIVNNYLLNKSSKFSE